jgi:hypothetical protein
MLLYRTMKLYNVDRRRRTLYKVLRPLSFNLLAIHIQFERDLHIRNAWHVEIWRVFGGCGERFLWLSNVEILMAYIALTLFPIRLSGCLFRLVWLAKIHVIGSEAE